MEGIFVVLAALLVYCVYNYTQKDGFRLAPRFLDLAASQYGREPSSETDLRNIATGVCDAVVDPAGKASCMRLTAGCAPAAWAAIDEVVRQRNLPVVHGIPSAEQSAQIAAALDRIASEAPMCSRALQTEGEVNAADFAALMRDLTGDPEYDLNSDPDLQMYDGGERLPLSAFRERILLAGVSAQNSAIIAKMLTDSAHLIPAQ